MGSLVEQLQVAASDSNVKVSDLLRKAKLVAAKLNQPEMMRWVDSELSGTFAGDDVPEYRRVPTQPVYQNAYWGRVPFVTSNAGINEIFNSSRQLPMSIGELEALLQGDDKVFYLNLSEGIYQKLRSWGIDGDIRPMSEISRASIVGVLDAVRTAILDWSIKLEANGIMGTGMSFSDEEKKRAQSVPAAAIHIHGNIGNFSGVIGTSTGKASVGATQRQRIDVAAASTVAQHLREAAESLQEEDATLATAAADAIDTGVQQAQADEGPLRKALAFAKAAIPKLGSFAAKAALEAEISHLLSA